MTKYFRGWRVKVDALVSQGHDIPPFQLSSTMIAQTPVLKAVCSFETNQVSKIQHLLLLYTTRMWANAQPDGRPAEHRWRPLFNAAKFG